MINWIKSLFSKKEEEIPQVKRREVTTARAMQYVARIIQHLSKLKDRTLNKKDAEKFRRDIKIRKMRLTDGGYKAPANMEEATQLLEDLGNQLDEDEKQLLEDLGNRLDGG